MYIPHSEKDIKEAFSILGIEKLDDLFSHIKEDLKSVPDLSEGKSEYEVLNYFDYLAKLNKKVINFAGFGVYDRIVPSVIGFILERGEFLTSYTPYQAEASQGTLQAMFEYQSLMIELTGMDVANASVYDGATALAEAILMATNIKEGERVLISEGVHPFYRRVVETYISKHGESLEVIPLDKEGVTDIEILKENLHKGKILAVVIQYPNFLGFIEPLEEIGKLLNEGGAVFIVVADPVALSILEPPSKFGADIVVGEGQQLGLPMNMGGPGIGFFTTRREYLRKLPGRISGIAEDIEGKRAFTLVLQTREQHIRRERATSNICTNQNLLAIANAIYLSLLGAEGLKEVAIQSISKALYLKKKLMDIGFEEVYGSKHLWEFPVKRKNIETYYRKALARDIIPGVLLSEYTRFEDSLLIAVTEKRTKEEIDMLIEALSS